MQTILFTVLAMLAPLATLAAAGETAQSRVPASKVAPSAAPTAAPSGTPSGATVFESVDSARSASAGAPGADLHQAAIGGILPKVVKARQEPYVVTADVYVPSGKTVVIEPGCVLLFNNFTGLHVEGKLVAEASLRRPIVFSSVMDQTYNPRTDMHANPYDWDGIYIHESGIGSTMSHCTIMYSTYGISTLTKYIKFDSVAFRHNGRSDLTIEGVKQPVSSAQYSYGMTIADARKDGVPVKILMDPMGKKRTLLRYCGIGLCAGGLVAGLWSTVAAANDQKVVNSLKDTEITGPGSNLIINQDSDFQRATQNRTRDEWIAATSFTLALLGAAGLCLSFTF
jgi:hypothetical protein